MQYLYVIARIPKHIGADYTTKEALDEAISEIVKDINIVKQYETYLLEKLKNTEDSLQKELLELKKDSIRPYLRALQTTEQRLRDVRVELLLKKPVSCTQFMEHQYSTSYSGQGLGMTTYIPGEMNSDYTYYASRKDIEDKNRREREVLASFNKTKSKA